MQQVVNIAFVIDISESTIPNPIGGFQTVPDVNGDGFADTILDAEIAAFEALVNAMANDPGLANAQVALIPFEDNASIVLQAPANADTDNDGVFDLVEAVRALRASGGTDFEAGLQQAETFFQTRPAGTDILFFLSDGQDLSPTFDDEVQRLLSDGVDIRAFGVGNSVDSAQLDLLDDRIANNSQTVVSDPSQLADAVIDISLNPAEIARVEILVDGLIVATLQPAQLTATPFGLRYDATLTGLSVGADETVTARVIATDGSATMVSTTQVLEGNCETPCAETQGNDVIYGGAGNDTIFGNGGEDFIAPGTGTNVVDGGLGVDTVMFDERSGDYAISYAGGVVTVRHLVTGETNTLRNVERLQFTERDGLMHTAPSFANAAPLSVRENRAAGESVGVVSAFDPDPGDSVIYRIAADSAGAFAIDPLTGELTITRSLSYASSSELDVVVEAQDVFGNRAYADLSVSVVQNPVIPVNGTNDADIVYSTNADEQFFLQGGNDTAYAGGGSDKYDGGEGTDQVKYQFYRSQVIVDKMGDGSVTVDKYLLKGQDELTSIERIDLLDGDYVFDIDSDNLGFGYRIYQASFGRTPDEGGVRFWIGVLDTLDDQGFSELGKQQYVANAFINSLEFQSLYGTNPSNFEYIDAMYQNVLFRLPDQEGYDFWVGGMEAGLSREDILIAFTQSQENINNNIANLDDGVWVV